MTSIIVNIAYNDQKITRELKAESQFDDFFEEMYDLCHGELHLDGENISEKYINSSIQETCLYDGADIIIIQNNNLYNVIIPQSKNIYVFYENQNKKILFDENQNKKILLSMPFAENEKCLGKMLQSRALSINKILPFDIIDQQFFPEYKIESYVPMCDFSNFEFLNEDHHYNVLSEGEQLQSELFKYDHIIHKRLIICDNVKLNDKITSLLKETGTVLAGSYPLSKIVDSVEPGDVDIFSYSLDFFRKLMNFIYSNREEFPQPEFDLWEKGSFDGLVSCHRCPTLDTYKFIIDGVLINFIHLGDPVPEDVILTAEENKTKILKRIEDKFDMVACMTCYDGEIIKTNKITLEKVSFYRKTTYKRLMRYHYHHGIKLIPIHEVKELENFHKDYQLKGGIREKYIATKRQGELFSEQMLRLEHEDVMDVSE